MTKDLRIKLADLVSDLKTDDGIPDYRTLLDKKATLVSTEKDSPFMDSNSVRTVVMDVAYKYANELGYVKRDFNETEKDVIVQRAYDHIQKVPIKYLFSFRMPYSKTAINYDVTNNIKLQTVIADKEQAKDRLRSDAIDSIRKTPSDRNDYEDGEVILTVRATGLIDRGAYKKYVISLPDSDPLFTFKVTVSALEAYGVISEKSQRPNALLPGNSKPYSVNIHYEKDFEFFTAYQESTEDYVLINRHGFDENTTDDQLKVLKSLFWKIDVKRRDHSRLLDEQRNIRISLYWYFESIKAKRSHEKLIYLTTAIDALLPELDTKEGKALLFATTISSDPISKNNHKNNIVTLYAMRNDIIHGKIPITSTHNPKDDKGFVAFKAERLLKVLLRKRLSDLSQTMSKLYIDV